MELGSGMQGTAISTLADTDAVDKQLREGHTRVHALLDITSRTLGKHVFLELLLFTLLVFQRRGTCPTPLGPGDNRASTQ